jgi:hypothetical protein
VESALTGEHLKCVATKTVGGAFRKVVHGLHQGVLYFQNVIQLHGTCEL